MSKIYRQWVKEYQDQAWAVARYILKDDQEAEDATQDAFVKLWNHQDKIDSLLVKPWLMKVTRHARLRLILLVIPLSRSRQWGPRM